MENIKKLNLLLEHFAKCPDIPKDSQKVYEFILETLSEENLCIKTQFECKQIDSVLKLNINDFNNAKFELERAFLSSRPESLKAQKEEVFNSLLKGNFPSHEKKLKKNIASFEASLSDVEEKMYVMIKTYVGVMCDGLEFFADFDEEKEKSIEELSGFAVALHEAILEHIFFEEERVHISDALKQVATIYISLYYQNFYILQK